MILVAYRVFETGLSSEQCEILKSVNLELGNSASDI